MSVSAVSIYKIIPSLNKLSNAFQGIQYFATPFKEIIDYLKNLEETPLQKSIKDFESISYNNISFKYDQDLILQEVNFIINKNDFIGLYGPSGSGKSTLIKILAGLITSDKGSITINGIEVKPIDLRSYFSYVPQDSIILDSNILTNVSLEFNVSKIDKEKVLSSLRKVDLYDKFKDNLESSLGESGIKVSGGQKQRIAIARALYHNKNILILDESTSNLDSITETKILDLLEKISREITIVIISHKKSSLAKCNKLYEINKQKNKNCFMKTIMITGCAGFIGQNLVEKLIPNNKIIGIDNLFSSDKKSINKFINHKNFEFINSCITKLPVIKGNVDLIYNLACPASPPVYQKKPLFTLDTNYIGTKKVLELAKDKSSIFIQASTSEVYGDPKENPQSEEYFGNVNTIGPRSCYDEGKRIAETLCYEYRKIYNLQTRIIRIFNTYGPGMKINDGRVISNFLVNIINGKELIVYGDGNQTRSFCYVDDLIHGLILASKVDFDHPINLGSNKEISLNKLLGILRLDFPDLKVKYIGSLKDDPKMRKPKIEKAKNILKWKPKTDIKDGIKRTFKYFKLKIKNEK